MNFNNLLSKLKRKTEEDNSNASSNPLKTKKKRMIINFPLEECLWKPITNIGTLATIGRNHKTDKITRHYYHRFYARYLQSFHESFGAKDEVDSEKKKKGMLEIGIDRFKSLSMWLDYFPNNYIYGVDIGISDQGDRYTIYQYDQSNINHLQTLTNTNIKHKIFFINDDGSHIPEHQLLSFNYLFVHLLEAEGIYAIEDLETSYWTHGFIYGYKTKYGYQQTNSAIEMFKQLTKSMYFFQNESAKEVLSPELEKMFSLEVKEGITSISYGHNCLILTKETKNVLEKYFIDPLKQQLTSASSALTSSTSKSYGILLINTSSDSLIQEYLPSGLFPMIVYYDMIETSTSASTSISDTKKNTVLMTYDTKNSSDILSDMMILIEKHISLSMICIHDHFPFPFLEEKNITKPNDNSMYSIELITWFHRFDLFFDQLLMFGGMYIISSMISSKGLELFLMLIDDINEEFLTEKAKENQTKALSSLLSLKTRQSISTLTWIREQHLLVLMKKTKEELELNQRHYIFAEKL